MGPLLDESFAVLDPENLERPPLRAPAPPTLLVVAHPMTRMAPMRSPCDQRQSLAARNRGAYLEVMLDWSECPGVERVPGKVSGAWLFRGTRVPVKALFENLENGARVDDFLEWFPGVARAQVEAVLEHAERSLAVA